MQRRKQTFKPRRGLRLALRRSAPLWWVLTITLGALTTMVVGSAISTATRAADAWGREREVWVVQRPVDAGDLIGVTAVRRLSLPRGVVPEGALPGTSSPVGEATRVGLARGEIVLTARLAGRGAHGVAAMVAPGYRAVALPYDDQMPRLRVGDRVDLIATFDVGDSVAESETAPSFPIAVDAEVLAVTPRAVTLAIAAEDATRVAFAVAKGALTIALRPPQERTARR